MRLAMLMIVVAYLYLVLRALHTLPTHACIAFGLIMAALTTANIVREWRDH